MRLILKMRIVVSMLVIMICELKVLGFKIIPTTDLGKTPSILVNNHTWLTGDSLWFRILGSKCSVHNQCLSVFDVKNDNGVDSLGTYHTTTTTYVSMMGPRFETVIKVYDDLDAVLFGQIFLDDTPGTSNNNNRYTCSGFPSFNISDVKPILGYYTPSGNHCGYTKATFGRFKADMDFPSGFQSGPIAIYDGTGHTVIISTFNNFMASSVWFDKSQSVLSFGLLGRATSVPRGHNLWTIIYHSPSGVNKAFEGWGALMQKHYGSSNRRHASTDIFVNYLGYWTDRGAFYYYHTEKGHTYEQTILDIWQDSKNNHIPYRYLQYDSWFYPKEGDSMNGGALRWVPKQDYFPHGPFYILNKTNLVAGTHLKWWSPHTPMAKQNGGQFDFIIEKDMALPTDEGFYPHIVRQSKTWGNQLLLQDWLAQMMDRLDVLQTNVTIGQQWLHHLSRAAQQSALTIELCTTYPRHNLAALQIPTATFTRVSEDYAPSNDNWKIGVTSLWVWSLGQTPFKDVFLTSSDQKIFNYQHQQQHQNQYKQQPKQQPLKFASGEHYPELESVVASLSAGPVAPGDQINKTNTTLLMRCCNKDGLILKPDKPATAIDPIFYKRSLNVPYGPDGEVYSTYTTIANMFFGIVFAADMKNAYNITTSEAFRFIGGQYYSIDYMLSSPPKLFTDQSTLSLKDCTKKHFCLYYASPKIDLKDSSIILVGETNKWIPHSKQRISDILVTSNHIKVKFKGSPGEVIRYTVYSLTLSRYIHLNCTMGPTGGALLNVLKQICDSF